MASYVHGLAVPLGLLNEYYNGPEIGNEYLGRSGHGRAGQGRVG